MNWRKFYKCVLKDGSFNEAAQEWFDERAGFIDSYGKHNELAEIATYWPTNAKSWFDAFRAT
jgi:hypothetical protein